MKGRVVLVDKKYDLESLKLEVNKTYKIKADKINVEETTFNEIIEQAIIEILPLVPQKINKKDKEDENITRILTNMTITKGKWIKYELTNSNSGYHKNLKATEEVFNSTNDAIIEGCTTLESYENKIKIELEEWKKNKKSELSDFRFLNSKKITAKKSALLNDIKIFLFYKIIRSKSKRLYEERMTVILDIPTESSSKIKLKPTEDEKLYKFDYNQNNQVVTYVFSDSDYGENNLTSPDNNSIKDTFEGKITEILKVLNESDIKLFQYIIKNKGANFFKDGVITFAIRDACKELYPTYYDERLINKVIASVIRLSRTTINIVSDQSFNGVITSLLENTIRFFNDNKKNAIQVIVSVVYRDQLLKKNLIRIYSELYNKYNDNNDVQKLLFVLQKERVVRHYNHPMNSLSTDYLRQETDYTYFTAYLIILNKRKDRVIKRIYDALKIIEADNSLINSVNRSGDMFTITYNPLTQQEIDDLELNELNIE